MGADPAFAALRERLDRRHREVTAAAFALGDEALVRTEIAALDAALGGGFSRGTIGKLEGPPTSGRSDLAGPARRAAGGGRPPARPSWGRPRALSPSS